MRNTVISSRLRVALQDSGRSVAEVARKAGLPHPQSLHNILNGRDPGYCHLPSLAEVLRKPLPWILGAQPLHRIPDRSRAKRQVRRLPGLPPLEGGAE